MADEKENQEASALRLKLGQSSVGGLNVFSGQIYEEKEHALRWPQAICTYEKMRKDATIAPALNLVEMAIARVPWVVKIPKGKEEQLRDKAKFLEEVMNDMDVPWNVFIRQAATHNTYGFAVAEKVYRVRSRQKGSKYNDGKIGLKKLAPIAQATINDWKFSDDGRELIGLTQRPTPISNRGQSVLRENLDDLISIPRKKFLLFRNNPYKDNPEGESPLNHCYIAWRYKSELEKHEALGVSSDLRGLKRAYIPPNYLAADASPEDKEVAEHIRRELTLLHKNEQSCVLLPNVYDDRGNRLFEFDLMSVMGQKAHNTDEIIQRYKKEIVTCLMASQLVLGQEGGGSYSLAESQSSISQMVIDARLIEIRDQLNHDLIPQLFALNGWDVTDTPYFDFGDIAEESLDEISKYIQRIAAVGLMPKTAPVVNWVTEKLGMAPQFSDSDEPENIQPHLTGYTSGAGEGMQKGSGSGTANNVSERDNSTSNLEN